LTAEKKDWFEMKDNGAWQALKKPGGELRGRIHRGNFFETSSGTSRSKIVRVIVAKGVVRVTYLDGNIWAFTTTNPAECNDLFEAFNYLFMGSCLFKGYVEIKNPNNSVYKQRWMELEKDGRFTLFNKRGKSKVSTGRYTAINNLTAASDRVEWHDGQVLNSIKFYTHEQFPYRIADAMRDLRDLLVQNALNVGRQ